ncbi:helix-turn-helix domain-containing protein [Paractinoplanes toevensis]|uniref:HTH cro/C1-type domain-containing protein n=1 Tax=Paractinoplanes toevensis TaxID=571911 RepID=A0A920BQX9_9ACTN|nr:helix-turn-helix domain-containing protein [Actinoplanes toevensis]GIM97932.1 hypothetical protein Ato02nite_097250 [Actinoplanes toevensis]
MTGADEADGAHSELSRRLRELRQRRWDHRRLTQKELADALGLSSTLISNWEKSSMVPPPNRLRDYATLLATDRSLSGTGLALLSEDQLTESEIAERDQLLEELLALRGEDKVAPEPTSRIRLDWIFPRRSSVRIICGLLDKPVHPYSQPKDPNYTELFTFADPDALIELHGHLWRMNPECDIRFRRSDRLLAGDSADDLNSHLILLGGIGLNQLTERVLRESGMPIKQKTHPDFIETGEIFEVTKGSEKIEFLPTMSGNEVVEDVGLLARMPNPNNSSTTLTICNGVFARGVVGAVRTLTDDNLRKNNEAYLTRRFGSVDRFAILMRVPVLFSGTVLTPDLQKEQTRLYEWSDGPVP